MWLRDLATANRAETRRFPTSRPIPESARPKCRLPTYFYKVLLKVRQQGSSIVSASAVGFWFDHKTYSGGDYTACSVSVDQIEQWTGIDFFVNLPDDLESAAEQNSSWKSFSDY